MFFWLLNTETHTLIFKHARNWWKWERITYQQQYYLIHWFGITAGLITTLTENKPVTTIQKWPTLSYMTKNTYGQAVSDNAGDDEEVSR